MPNEIDPSDEPIPEEYLDRLNRTADADGSLRAESRSGGDEGLPQVEEIWRLSEAPRSPEGWPELAAAMAALEREKRTIPLPASERKWPTLLRAAALIVMGIGLGFLASRAGAGIGSARQMTVLSVPAGATSAMDLPGGVRVRLNSLSTLRYVEASERVWDVELEGEAFFEVPHDPEREFVVRTAAGIVRDLGTEFNVWAREARLAVMVSEGEVQLEGGGASVVVQAGQESFATRGEAPTEPTSANVEAVRAWLRGEMVFIDQPLSNVAAEMERRYGVEFEVSRALRERRITVTLRTRSDEDAARAICDALSADCRALDDGWSISEF